MATGKKTGGRNFPAGNSGRPKGSKNKVVSRKVLEANKKEIEVLISKYLNLPLAKLRVAATKPTTKSMDLMIIKIIIEAIKKGDFTRLNFLLDRTIGKVKDTMDINNPDGNMLSKVIVTLPSNGREKKK